MHERAELGIKHVWMIVPRRGAIDTATITAGGTGLLSSTEVVR